jgi:DNA-binding HxlR family transcriptional regulator
MSTTDVTPRVCSVARTLEVVGEKWSLLAIREVFLGVRRFEEMLANIGAPRDTLANRLRTLVEAGILEKRRYSERPPRDEYVLTDAGRDLYPVILSLMQWGDKHLPLESGPPMRLKHDCGKPLHTHLACDACGGRVDRSSVERIRARSGATPRGRSAAPAR